MLRIATEYVWIYYILDILHILYILISIDIYLYISVLYFLSVCIYLFCTFSQCVYICSVISLSLHISAQYPFKVCTNLLCNFFSLKISALYPPLGLFIYIWKCISLNVTVWYYSIFQHHPLKGSIFRGLKCFFP